MADHHALRDWPVSAFPDHSRNPVVLTVALERAVAAGEPVPGPLDPRAEVAHPGTTAVPLSARMCPCQTAPGLDGSKSPTGPQSPQPAPPLRRFPRSNTF